MLRGLACRQAASAGLNQVCGIRRLFRRKTTQLSPSSPSDALCRPLWQIRDELADGTETAGRSARSPGREARPAAVSITPRRAPLRLLALIEKPDHVCYRYRVEAYEPWLKARGWIVEARPIPHDPAGWTRLLRHAARADAVVLQRKLIAPWWLWLLRRTAHRLIYDIDDAMFCRDSNSSKPPHSPRRMRRFCATVRAADVVLAGNRHLAEQAAALAPAAQIHLAPTCVDPSAYPLAPHRRCGAAAQLVWIGSRSTMTSLDEAREGLAAAAERLGALELRVVCDAAPELAGVNVAFRRWSKEAETAEIAAADVGVSWLPDHPWSRGKCGLKVLQYMAAGLPTVANPIGVHCEMIEHGRTGMLASTPGEWAECIAQLAGNPELRRQIGLRAREAVEQRYSIRHWGREYARIISGERRAASSLSAPHAGAASHAQTHRKAS